MTEKIIFPHVEKAVKELLALQVKMCHEQDYLDEDDPLMEYFGNYQLFKIALTVLGFEHIKEIWAALSENNLFDTADKSNTFKGIDDYYLWLIEQRGKEQKIIEIQAQHDSELGL